MHAPDHAIQRTPAQRSVARIYRHWSHLQPNLRIMEQMAVVPLKVNGDSNQTLVEGKAGVHWKNWAEIHHCQPQLYFKPTSAEEIIQIIKLARQKGQRVKVVGAGHSPTDCAVTEGFMVSLEKYDRILSVDSDTCVVKVEAGITFENLSNRLEPHKIGLPNLGSIAEQTVAGALATGTHGTGIGFGILGTMVTELEVITAKGDIMVCSKENRPHIFYANLCGLGAVGIISTVTLQLEPLFNLHAIAVPMKLNPLLSNINAIVHSSEHVRIWWIPHTDTCWVWRANRTKLPRTPPARLITFRNLFNLFTVRKLYEFLLWLATFQPKIIPLINKFYRILLFRGRKQLVDRSDHLFTFDCLFKQYVSEWAIPIEKTTTAMVQLQELIKSHKLNVHFSVEIRFTRADNIWLSPSYGRDSAWIGIIMYRPYGKDTPGTREYFDGFEQIMTSLDGRPHWAKAFQLTGAEFVERYPHWEDWKKVRDEVDPPLPRRLF